MEFKKRQPGIWIGDKPPSGCSLVSYTSSASCPHMNKFMRHFDTILIGGNWLLICIIKYSSTSMDQDWKNAYNLLHTGMVEHNFIIDH